MIARVFISTLRGSMAKVILPALLSSTFCIHCASDQKSGQQGDPIDEIASQGSAESTALNENGGSKNSEASAQGASMNNAVEGAGEGAGEFAGEGNSGGNSGGNFSGGNNSEGNSFGNNSGAGNGGATVTNENAALGASLNNVEADDPLAGDNAPLNTTLNATTNPPLNPAAESGSNTLTPVTANSAPAVDAPQSAPAPAQSTANANARAAASPFNNPHMNWPGKGKVKYVTRQVTRHASPNGPVVGEFEQGEHPLIFQNGNWVELNDGSFVKGNGLSDKGVGYAKGKQNWR